MGPYSRPPEQSYLSLACDLGRASLAIWTASRTNETSRRLDMAEPEPCIAHLGGATERQEKDDTPTHEKAVKCNLAHLIVFEVSSAPRLSAKHLVKAITLVAGRGKR